MNEMVDRVAQAMVGNFAGGHPEDIAYWRAAARKAIAAMREPTRKMLEAMFWAETPNETKASYQAAIEEALK